MQRFKISGLVVNENKKKKNLSELLSIVFSIHIPVYTVTMCCIRCVRGINLSLTLSNLNTPLASYSVSNTEMLCRPNAAWLCGVQDGCVICMAINY